MLQRIDCVAGKTIFRKGDPADGLYIVGNGSVGLYFPTNLDMIEPDIKLKKNDILGEMGVIDSAPRMATAKALENSTVLFLSKRGFEDRLAESDIIVRGVMAILSERLRVIQRAK